MASKERIELNKRFCQALAELEASGGVAKHSQSSDKVSYKELAVIMGNGDADMPTSRLADYKSGKRLVGYPEAIRFADAFGLDKSWLILGEAPSISPSFSGNGRECKILVDGMIGILNVDGKCLTFDDFSGAADYFYHLYTAIGYKTIIQNG